MKSHFFPLLLTVVSIGLAIGVGMAWDTEESEAQPESKVAAATQTQSQTTKQSATPDHFSSLWNSATSASSEMGKEEIIEDLWERAMTPAEKLKVGDDAQDKLRKLAQSDPEVLKNLLKRYDTVTDPNAKELLQSLLSTIDSPEILNLSKRLATTGTAAQKQEGFAMLQNMTESTREVRNIIKQTLATEQNPAVLVQALGALKATDADPAESAAIVTQLKGLTQNADPAVRSTSLLQLAQWDKSGAAQANLTQALNDPAPEVRQTAIFAIAQSETRTDSMKATLFGIINNANESKEMKGSALQALERFTLSSQETANYNQVRSQIVGAAVTGG